MIARALSRLTPDAFASAAAVAVRSDQTVTWGTLRRDVDALAAAILSRGPGRWLLYADDAYAFAVGLLALWQSRSIAVVPPNAQPGTLADLTADVRGIVSDRRVAAGALKTPLDADDGAPVAPRRWEPLDPSAPRLELFTSGTAGPRKTVSKTLRHLDEEIAGLEAQFGALARDRQVFSTVSHHHIYGLLFRLLWPLCAGRPFRAETCAHADELAPRVGRHGRAVLVTAPVHLRRLMAAEDFRTLGPSCGPIFSSGGPLDEATADAVADAFGEAAIEVLGATETGGIAWRRQRPGPLRLAWTPFPRVAVGMDAETGRLLVTSPFAGDSESAGPLVVEDRGRFLPDGRFLLLARADRTVKVGERRVSLPEMEAELRGHPAVADAALALLPGPPEPRIAAVVVPSAAGRADLAARGRRGVAGSLARHLRSVWHPVLVPRRWRYVDELPRDAQGKVTAAAIRELFAPPPAPAALGPEVLEETIDPDACERTLHVPAGLAALEGHFPGQPIVPGVAQIGWVVDAARELLGGDVDVAVLEALKFKAVLRPGQRVRLRVALDRARGALEFRLWSGATVFASGRGRLRAPAEPAAGIT